MTVQTQSVPEYSLIEVYHWNISNEVPFVISLVCGSTVFRAYHYHRGHSDKTKFTVGGEGILEIVLLEQLILLLQYSNNLYFIVLALILLVQ